MPNTDRAPSAARPSQEAEVEIDHRYLIEDLLGRGGMGHVYRVRDTATGATVALKKLRSAQAQVPRALRSGTALTDEADEEAARMARRLSLFEREYHTLAELKHPRIIEVYEYGWDQGAPYYTMELLTGRDMTRLGLLPWSRACAVLRDVASALTLLHSRRLLHRDVSPGNVHEQANGSCKLIDFGAMGTMGKATAIVGTPAFMPPELLQDGRLDARSDLYSLGALGYYLVTGRSVHPVRSLSELRNFVGCRPKAPSVHVPELPRAFDALLLQLLSPDVAERPATAVEVIERLSAIADMKPELAQADAAISASNVATPAFVGREAELGRVRRRIARMGSHKGSALLVAARRGGGRTRFLEACILSGKLAGARVLSADADSAEQVPYALVTGMLRQLHASFGSGEKTALALPNALALALAPELASQDRDQANPESTPTVPAVRNNLHDAILEYIAQVAAHRSLLLTVENLERADRASAALLSALAQRAGSLRVVMVAAIDSDASTLPEHVHAFALHASRLPLPALSAEETARLLGSVFGDVPNLAPVAARIHALASGNPRLSVELAQHLVETGVIRYESGGYLLPELFAEGDLPESLAEALYARAGRLSPEARALSLCLSACAEVRLTCDEAVAIAELGAAGPLALSELSAAQMIELRGAGPDSAALVSLRQPALGQALLEALPNEERRSLHARIAALLAFDPARRLHAAEHYFLAEQAELATDALLSAMAAGVTACPWHPRFRRLVENGLSACERAGRATRDAFILQSGLAEHVLNYNEPCETEQLLLVTRVLWRLTGLSDWEDLGAESDPKARLSQALSRAQTRYDQTPVSERILPPAAAIRQLLLYLLRLTGFASTALNLELLQAIPSLLPFAPLNASVLLLDRLVTSLRDLRAGRTERYLEGVDLMLKSLAKPDGSGFPAEEARTIRVNLLYGLALANGALGRNVAFECATEMESVPRHTINAWRTRQLAHLFWCNPREAELCRREVELMQLSQPSRQFHHGGTVETEVIVYAQADDLLGLRRVLPGIERMAAIHPGWRPVYLVARAALQRVRGRLEEALSLYSEAVELAPAGRHIMWSYAVGGQLQTLIELGRAGEAKALGRRHRATAQRHDLVVSRHLIDIPLSHAEALLGEHAAAEALVEEMIAEVETSPIRGLLAGVVYEAAARSALCAKDAIAFERYYAGCVANMPEGRFPALSARLSRLLEGARRISTSPAPDEHGEESRRPAFVRRQLALCALSERPARALALALAATSASEGFLYTMVDGALVLRACSGRSPPPEDLLEFLQRFLSSARLLREQTVDLSYATAILDAQGALEPVLLSVKRGGERVVVALLALAFTGGRRWPKPELLDSLAEGLDCPPPDRNT